MTATRPSALFAVCMLLTGDRHSGRLCSFRRIRHALGRHGYMVPGAHAGWSDSALRRALAEGVRRGLLVRSETALDLAWGSAHARGRMHERGLGVAAATLVRVRRDQGAPWRATLVAMGHNAGPRGRAVVRQALATYDRLAPEAAQEPTSEDRVSLGMLAVLVWLRSPRVPVRQAADGRLELDGSHWETGARLQLHGLGLTRAERQLAWGRLVGRGLVRVGWSGRVVASDLAPALTVSNVRRPRVAGPLQPAWARLRAVVAGLAAAEGLRAPWRDEQKAWRLCWRKIRAACSQAAWASRRDLWVERPSLGELALGGGYRPGAVRRLVYATLRDRDEQARREAHRALALWAQVDGATLLRRELAQARQAAAWAGARACMP